MELNELLLYDPEFTDPELSEPELCIPDLSELELNVPILSEPELAEFMGFGEGRAPMGDIWCMGSSVCSRNWQSDVGLWQQS